MILPICDYAIVLFSGSGIAESRDLCLTLVSRFVLSNYTPGSLYQFNAHSPASLPTMAIKIKKERSITFIFMSLIVSKIDQLFICSAICIYSYELPFHLTCVPIGYVLIAN